MADALITLTTDFGTASPYVAAMKGVLLGINPRARVLDLTHEVPPQDLHYTAYFLANAIPYFAPEVLHVVVVDPGVGSDRAVLLVEVDGHRLLVPDNGCWTSLVREGAPPPRVLRLDEPRYWRKTVSATFHGRDVFAPAAAHLSRGVEPGRLGTEVTDWVRLETLRPTAGTNAIGGQVIFVDRFGNLITNIPAGELPPPDVLFVGPRRVRRRFRWVKTYADAAPGALVALPSSNGLLEVAVAQGNAARKLDAAVGTAVTVGWLK
jgi:S-adenosylmethionine hydrolase